VADQLAQEEARLIEALGGALGSAAIADVRSDLA
jgi:hypothetical protein